MDCKLFDSELKVMDVLWSMGALRAVQIADIMLERHSWNRNTTYTVLKKLIDKNAVERIEPYFTCRALISKEQVQTRETNELIGKLFDSSKDLFLSAFLSNADLSKDDLERLKQMIDTME